MGGVWERMFRSARAVFSALLDQHGTKEDDELLRTLMVEVKAIVNSQPLTYSDMTTPDSAEPLTSSQHLTLKSNVVQPLPWKFMKVGSVGEESNFSPISKNVSGINLK